MMYTVVIEGCLCLPYPNSPERGLIQLLGCIHSKVNTAVKLSRCVGLTLFTYHDIKIRDQSCKSLSKTKRLSRPQLEAADRSAGKVIAGCITADPQGISLKIDEKHCIFITASDLE